MLVDKRGEAIKVAQPFTLALDGDLTALDDHDREVSAWERRYLLPQV